MEQYIRSLGECHPIKYKPYTIKAQAHDLYFERWIVICDVRRRCQKFIQSSQTLWCEQVFCCALALSRIIKTVWLLVYTVLPHNKIYRMHSNEYRRDDILDTKQVPSIDSRFSVCSPFSCGGESGTGFYIGVFCGVRYWLCATCSSHSTEMITSAFCCCFQVVCRRMAKFVAIFCKPDQTQMTIIRAVYKVQQAAIELHNGIGWNGMKEDGEHRHLHLDPICKEFCFQVGILWYRSMMSMMLIQFNKR